MKKRKVYHDFYLNCDVLLLANIFEKIRNNNLKNYGLSPSHYLSVPGLSLDAMLKMTKIELEVIPDPEYLKSYDQKQESKIKTCYLLRCE